MLSKLIKLTPIYLVTIGLIFLPVGNIKALSGSDFKPGRIIDDVVFTNKSSMTVSQIQAFLDAKIPVCDSDGSEPYAGTTRAAYTAASATGNPLPFVCLNQYYENPEATYAVTHTYTNTLGQTVNTTYNYHQNNYYQITSFNTYYVNGDPAQGVSVVRPVYQNKNGVIPAGAKSAAQLIWDVSQTYNINPQAIIVLLQKEQGLVTDDWAWAVQYEKATGYMCPDTAPCNPSKAGFYNQIENAAWQFRNDLDNITVPGAWGAFGLGWNNIPYNPNSACGTKSVYIENKATAVLYKYTPYTPNDAALTNLYGSGDSCSAYGNRNFWRYFNDWFGSTLRTLVTAPGLGVYLIENGYKRPFPNEITFLSHSYKWADVLSISTDELFQFPDGQVMQYNSNFRNGYLITSTNYGVYVVVGGKKLAIPSEEIFNSQLYSWTEIIKISDFELTLIPEGNPIPYDTNFREGQLVTALWHGVYLVQKGTRRPFPNEIIFKLCNYSYSNLKNLSVTELNLIPEGTPMLYDNHRLDNNLVSSGGGVYLVENGFKRPFPTELVFLSNGYLWSNIVLISNDELKLIPTSASMTYNVHFRDGILVSSPEGGMYVIDSGKKRPFPNEEVFLSYGYKWSDALAISNIEVSLIPEGLPMPQKT